jgi:TonB family protein
MNFSRRLALVAIPVCLWCGLTSAQTGNDAQAARQENLAKRALPKTFTCPSQSLLGDVSLRIVIDTKGNVSEVKALSGPEKLIPGAEACAKTWKYEKPPSAPATRTVLIRYETRDCPGAESQRGELQFSWGLRNQANFVLAYIEGEQPAPPLYPEEERKAGKVGGMALSVGLNPDGTVKDVHVLRGLSPRLDNEMMDRLRPLKFKVLDGVSEQQLQGLLFQIIFHATCPVQNVYNADVED